MMSKNSNTRLNKKEIITSILSRYPKSQQEKIVKAIKFAEKAHKGEKRLSGEEFFFHPLNVASIVAEMGLDATSIIVALLHHSIRKRDQSYFKNKELPTQSLPEENKVTLLEIGKQFTSEIVTMIQKISEFSNATRSNSENETITKFLLESSTDLRPILIKLADRLDNARTMDAIPPDGQKKMANNLINIYSPLCEYLNLYETKVEFEEIAFKKLNPPKHIEIDQYIKKIGLLDKQFLPKITNYLSSICNYKVDGKDVGLNIYGRVKGHYSIYKKINKRGFKAVEETTDLIGFTILAPTKDDCYKVAKKILQNTDPVLHEYDDYITKPKNNGYQAIQILTYLEVAPRPVEIQIKTVEMNHYNTYGPASHIAYKLSKDGNMDPQQIHWIKSIHKTLFEYHSKKRKPFSLPIKNGSFKRRIYVFTDKDRLIDLPVGSTAIDFAYTLHTTIGNSAVGCKVNREHVPLYTVLQNGDKVEILRDPNQTLPPEVWLEHVKTRRAREAIEDAYRKIVFEEVDLI